MAPGFGLPGQWPALICNILYTYYIWDMKVMSWASYSIEIEMFDSHSDWRNHNEIICRERNLTVYWNVQDFIQPLLGEYNVSYIPFQFPVSANCRLITMSISEAPWETAKRISSSRLCSGVCPAGNPVATEIVRLISWSEINRDEKREMLNKSRFHPFDTIPKNSVLYQKILYCAVI